MGNLRPGDAGYAKAALAAGNAQVVFASGASAGAHVELELEGGATYAFYVIQNGKTSTFLAANPDNKARRRGRSPSSRSPPRIRTGSTMSTPRSSLRPGCCRCAGKISRRGGDADYNDVVMTATGLAASSDDVMYVYEARMRRTRTGMS